MLWAEEAALAGWQAQRRSTPGGQPRYSELAIELVLTLRLVFHLTLRQEEGFARRRWIKLHPSVDAGTGETAAHSLTDGNEDDAAHAPVLLRQPASAIASLTAGGTYDSNSVHRAVAVRQPRSPPEVVVPPRTNAVLSTADLDR